MTTAERKQGLAGIMSEAFGFPVEITIRGLHEFTISTDDVTPTLGDKVREFFATGSLPFDIRTEHDDECGSFAYIDFD